MNTYTHRFVVASQYDTGSGILTSYYVILHEMVTNQIPRSYMQQIMRKARKYPLGRCSESKLYWFGFLSSEINNLNLDGEYADFLACLELLLDGRQGSLQKLVLVDDVTPTPKRFNRMPKSSVFESGDPIIVLDYRGPISQRCYSLLRRSYRNCFATFRHDNLFETRGLIRRGVERTSAAVRQEKFVLLNRLL